MKHKESNQSNQKWKNISQNYFGKGYTFIDQNKKTLALYDIVQQRTLTIKLNSNDSLVTVKVSTNKKDYQKLFPNILTKLQKQNTKSACQIWIKEHKNISVSAKVQFNLILIDKKLSQLGTKLKQFLESSKREQQSKSKARYQYLCKTIYYIQLQRRKRGKASKISLINDLLNQNNPTECSQTPEECYNLTKKKMINQQETHENKSTEKILNGIKIEKFQEITSEQFFQGTFTHISQLVLTFQYIFSVNMKTNMDIEDNGIQNNKSMKINQKFQKRRMIKKQICPENCQKCFGNQKISHKQNKATFYNEIKILQYLKNYFNKSIACYFLKPYNNYKDIKQIYSGFQPKSSQNYITTLQSKTGYSELRILHRVLKFLLQVSQALTFLIGKNILHRDIKLSNIRVGIVDEKKHAKLIDFGSGIIINQQIDQNNPKEKRQSQLRSTIFLPYDQLPWEIKVKYERKQFQKHTSFDIYAVGEIIEKTTSWFHGQGNKNLDKIKETLRYIIRKCKTQNPDDRFNPQELNVMLEQITYIVQMQK